MEKKKKVIIPPPPPLPKPQMSGATAERLVRESIKTAGVTGLNHEIQFVDSDLLAQKINAWFNL